MGRQPMLIANVPGLSVHGSPRGHYFELRQVNTEKMETLAALGTTILVEAFF